MKRDLELWRKILLKVEELPPGMDLCSPLDIDGYDEQITAEHVQLLEEAGFIEAMFTRAFNSFGVKQVQEYVIVRLLNDEHDFVANAKNPKIWQRTVDFIKERGGDVSLAVTKAVMAKEALQLFGLN